MKWYDYTTCPPETTYPRQRQRFFQRGVASFAVVVAGGLIRHILVTQYLNGPTALVVPLLLGVGLPLLVIEIAYDRPLTSWLTAEMIYDIDTIAEQPDMGPVEPVEPEIEQERLTDTPERLPPHKLLH